MYGKDGYNNQQHYEENEEDIDDQQDYEEASNALVRQLPEF